MGKDQNGEILRKVGTVNKVGKVRKVSKLGKVGKLVILLFLDISRYVRQPEGGRTQK